METTSLESHFEFGPNWEKLLPQIDEDRVQSAKSDIAKFMQRTSLEGLSFLDVGCGSGLSSLAAYRLGAASIVSIDIDPKNIANCEALKRKFGVPSDFPWQVYITSIVEDGGAHALPMADIVYSWGVLHHTGDMWKGVDNCARLVKPNGLPYLMLYRDAHLASTWREFKRIYTRGGAITKWLMRNSFAAVQILGLLAKGRNPRRVIRDYPKNGRGMAWYVDSIDWIGGYPFQYASAEETIAFLAKRGFKLQNIFPKITPRSSGIKGTGSYQYLFVRESL
ncbi:MAG: class I SAM-dependent methyltransferase [Alphaproteobacteria bacterium]|nr:class I SAM-dependent methyltransferase [Alphaproteobacteria bacterium]